MNVFSLMLIYMLADRDLNNCKMILNTNVPFRAHVFGDKCSNGGECGGGVCPVCPQNPQQNRIRYDCRFQAANVPCALEERVVESFGFVG